MIRLAFLLAALACGCSLTVPSYEVPDAFCSQGAPGQCGLANVTAGEPLTPPPGQCYMVEAVDQTFLAPAGTEACDAERIAFKCVVVMPGDGEPEAFDSPCASPSIFVTERYLKADGSCPLECGQ